MRLVIAYDKFPPAKGTEERSDPIKEVLTIIIAIFRSRGWLFNSEDQFHFTLNTTIEVELPLHVTAEKEILAVANEISEKLKAQVQTKVYYAHTFGTGNSGLNQGQFYELVNNIIRSE